MQTLGQPTMGGQAGLDIRCCRICKQNKAISLFVKSKAFKSGIDTICLECSREKVKAWRKTGKRKAAEETRRWNLKNPGKRKAIRQKYNTSKKKRIPTWANINKITEIYLNCPDGFHVDHIIPLQGKTVSGLHVETNLQYLPAKANMSKGNRYDSV